MAGYLVSGETKNALQTLLATGPDGKGNGAPYGQTGRLTTIVRITDLIEQEGECPPPRYHCVPTYYNTHTNTWVEYDESYCEEANGNELEIDKRYIAVRFGDKESDSKAEFRTTTQLITDYIAGCGITLELEELDSGDCGPPGMVIAVEVEQLRGCGLKVQTDNPDCHKLAVDLDQIVNDDTPLEVYDEGSGLCPTLKVRFDCGLKLDDDKNLELDYTNVAGDGLGVSAPTSGDDCPKLKVNVGCGLEIDADNVKVKRDDLIGDGLEADPDGCKIRVNHGCGIGFDGSGAIEVKVPLIVGTGLQVESTSGCDRIKFPLDASAGPAFSAITSLSFSGCAIHYTVTPFSFTVNPDGVLLGFEAGSDAEYTIPTAGICECCEDNTADPCASWNCVDGDCVKVCDDTGTYETKAECLAARSWDCEDGECVPKCAGAGEYATQAECVADCVEVTYNCSAGVCVDPGDGTGEYTGPTALTDCQADLTYDCVDGACVPVCDGTGAYTTSDCDDACAGGGGEGWTPWVEGCGPCDLPRCIKMTITNVVNGGGSCDIPEGWTMDMVYSDVPAGDGHHYWGGPPYTMFTYPACLWPGPHMTCDWHSTLEWLTGNSDWYTVDVGLTGTWTCDPFSITVHVAGSSNPSCPCSFDITFTEGTCEIYGANCNDSFQCVPVYPAAGADFTDYASCIAAGTCVPPIPSGCECHTLAIAGHGTVVYDSGNDYSCYWSGAGKSITRYSYGGGSSSLYIPGTGYYYLSSGGPVGTYNLSYGYGSPPSTIAVSCAD